MQSIVIHPVKHMALNFIGFVYVTTSSFILIEVLPALLMNFNATKCVPVDQWWPQFYPIWTYPDLKQSPFYRLPFLSMLGKVLAPSSGLTLLGKVLTKEDTCFVIPHFELTFLLEMPEIILLATFNPKIHVVIR